MIHANELRIGNYVLYLNELYKVSGITIEENQLQNLYLALTEKELNVQLCV